MDATKIKRIAYFIWRGLPAGSDLDDIQSEAVLGALQSRDGCEVIAAKRAIFNYLRRCNPGSRGTGRQCLNTVWWLPTTEARQENSAIARQERERLKNAVDTLTAKELAVINEVFWSDSTQADSAKKMGTTDGYFSRVKARAIKKLRVAMAA